MTIRVAIADDQTLVRAGFRILVDSDPQMTVVGEAVDGRSAYNLARTQNPDVILMDIRMPDIDGVEATRAITCEPELAATRVLILTTYETDQNILESIRAGASGFLIKDANPSELLNAIRIVANGEALLAPRATRRLIEAFIATPKEIVSNRDSRALEVLTDREREVLVQVGNGLNNVEIAKRLSMSPATAKTHISHILAKLDARDRAQLVIIAYETGLVVPGTHRDR